MEIRFSADAARDLEPGLGREWLVTNGIGGYASGTIVGINTRRYHGLLMAAVRPPVDRVALLVRLFEVVTVGGEMFELGAAEYEDGTLYPRGYQHLQDIALEHGVPTWTFTAGGILLRRAIWMVRERNVTVVRYRLLAGRGPVELALRPLTAARDHHACQHGNAEWRFAQEAVQDGVRVQATPQSPALWLLSPGATYSAGGDWYWRFLLREEWARGYDHLEDLYQPGTFRATLQPGASLTFIASADDPSAGLPAVDAELAEARMRSARRAAGRPLPTPTAGGAPAWLSELVVALQAATAAFVVRRPAAQQEGGHTSLIAGYPWFTDWGRDAMISLPGALLLAGRARQAADLLRTFAAYVDQGMIPNRFPDSGERVEYNTADATLWFFGALERTLTALGTPSPDDAPRAGPDRRSLLRELYPTLREIVGWHRRGTRYGIGVDPADGLLRAGQQGAGPDNPDTQLTWMDARTEGISFTPRIGKPVEINALWIHALALMAGWAAECEDDPAPYRQALDLARSSFARRFWHEAGGYLYDVIDGPDGDDASLRPNQLIALALGDDLVPPAQARAALDAVADRLLTPYGLRTLAPDDPRYQGRCEGDQPARDRAYHQGTVWPWLLGPYADAVLRVHGEPQRLLPLLEPFVAHLHEAGLGSVSEIFDGDAPHAPRGCIAQCWSVAELLRIAHLLT